MKLTSNYYDLLFNEAANDEWCEFIAEKIRGIVHDPETAERLIPTDHRFGGKRPPFVNGYFEAFNDPKVSLVDLRETPIVRRDRDGDRDDRRRARVRHHRVGDRLRLRHRRAQPHGDPSVATGSRSPSTGPTARRTFLGLQTRGFPNFFFPGGPHAAAGNNPRYNGDLVDIVTDTLVYATEHGYDVIEVSAEAEERWTRMVDKGAAVTTFGTIGQYVGSNIPGKPRRYLLNTGGRLKLFEISADVVANDYRAFEMSKASDAWTPEPRQTVAIGVSGEPTMPGSRSGGAVSRKRLRSCSRSQVASSCRYHISPSGTPSLNRQRWWIGSSVRLPSTNGPPPSIASTA